MKKLTILILSILSIFILSSCISKESPMELELKDIICHIPYEFSDDVTLPSSSDYDVKYYIDGKDIGYSITYDVYDNESGIIYYGSKTYEITVVVSDGENEISKTITLTRKANKDKYIEYMKESLDSYIDDYLSHLPAYISGDFSLPKYKFPSGIEDEIEVTTTMKIEDGVFKYNYPKSTSSFKLNITLTEDGIEVTRNIDIPILSIEEKNQVPRIYLEVSGTINKETYQKGTFTLMTRAEANSEWVDEMSSVSISIRGRGNSTWGFDKKPYKIKFNERTSLFGEPKAKTWTLIANYIDHSLMRNYAAYYLGRSLDGLEHTTCAYYVDVYLNGEYQGNYLLCEQVEVDKNRLNIDASIEGNGFLLEMDQKYFESNTGTEGIDYFYSKLHGNDFLFSLKDPDPEDINAEKVAGIKSYLDEAIAALKANTSDMYRYFDLSSVVDTFIINELTKNKDVGWSSFYLYRDGDGKISFGPIWDYDLSSLGQGNISKEERSVTGWFTDTGYKNPFYEYFMRNDTFKKAVKRRFFQIKDKQIADMIQELERTKDYIYYSALENFKVWNVIGRETGWWISDEEHAVKTWQGQVDLLINYYKDRIEWMSSELENW